MPKPLPSVLLFAATLGAFPFLNGCATTGIVQSPRTLPLASNPLEQGYSGPRQVKINNSGTISWGKRSDGSGLELQLCHVHYHDPTEHRWADMTSNQLVEIHYVFADSPRAHELSHCDQPLVVVAVIAQKDGTGPSRVDPRSNFLPAINSLASWEYRGSTTGASKGKSPVFWHVVRHIFSVKTTDLHHLGEKETSRALQDSVLPRPSITLSSD